MASGSSKQDAIKSATKSAVKAAAPKSYSDPNGSFANGVYSPNQSAMDLATQNTLDAGINNAANTVAGQSFNVNDAYNNPFYDSTYSLVHAPTERQYGLDQTSLNNELNAKGLTGGSYDALRNNNLAQNYQYNTQQDQGQARTASANAYQQQYQNALSGLQGLGQAQTQQTAQYYQPFNNYIAYQGAVNPGSQVAAQAYMNQGNQLAQIPSFGQTAFNNYLSVIDRMNNGAAAIAGAAKGGGVGVP